MTSFSLSGKTALITGASGGLGAHFAHTLASAGAQVVLAARRIDALAQQVDDLNKAGFSAFAVAMDVTDAGSVQRALDSAAAWAPDNSISILINNAGISREGMAHTMTEDDWDAVLDTNLKGPWLTTKLFVQQRMRSGLGGSIVHIGSILGERVAQGVAAYAAAKAGLHHLTRAQALEFSRLGFRVNALAPGYIETDLNRAFFQTEAGLRLIKRMTAKRLGQPSELDGALLLLASDASSFINGSVLTIDGGHCVSTL
ncbi:MAG: SDR family oxidoreductase [Moraxellaceae bacterium]|nr:SDR family oxidoreductase [Moraxellaceae bacterium]MDP1775188.1 SDR family oxidoreductase [Moraxellaceae bacterium]MDZ4296883.1 SDR family oxidoreductase [Moraxellaceae bacterium]MDZ4386562.1 SDR family oxidoreductase [Moraxellaceae bacterium]